MIFEFMKWVRQFCSEVSQTEYQRCSNISLTSKSGLGASLINCDADILPAANQRAPPENTNTFFFDFSFSQIRHKITSYN